METEKFRLEKLINDLRKTLDYFFVNFESIGTPVHIYTHLDADGLSAGAILGKALYREKIPFQITTLRQLERTEIAKISRELKESKSFLIFSDFGSGQYRDLQDELTNLKQHNPILILDHHIPQDVSNKEEIKKIEEIHEATKPWHINPYFFGIDGSIEISGAGLCYYFAKCLNNENIDFSPLAIIGAVGDIQNKGFDKSFQGLNTLILEDAVNSGYIEVINDLNFPTLKPLNEAIAYSSEIQLPGLSNDVNRTLIFLKTKGILMENSDGRVKTLNELNQDEKQKISSAIIEYASIKMDLEPSKIVKKLIVNRYLLKKEPVGSELHVASEFSNLLNACGRTHNASLGIGIAMGDRKKIYQQSKDILKKYRKSIVESLTWLRENDKIQQKEWIQYFFGEDVIPESIIGTIASILIFENAKGIDELKPLFGLAQRVDEKVYKVSGRAHQKLLDKGINLSEVVREACKLSDLDVLGGGHPPAAGTKIPEDKVSMFLDNCNKVVHKQIQEK
ncbi:MAG: DHHA1 domain-containing protein [Promethearchaeota archaeon]|jgi:RecJ-like exonuclease